MKNFLINYYEMLILIIFIVNNIILENLKFSGILYHLITIIIYTLNIIILIKYKDKIKFKGLAIIIWVLILFFSKNIYNGLFNLSSMISLMIIGFNKNLFVKIITILIIGFTSVTYPIIIFFFLLTVDNNGINDISKDNHYYCENNYEIYMFSAGAMDSFHYSIGKNYDILNIDGIISISYKIRNEKTEAEYTEFLKNHKCSLVGDKNESKKNR